MILSKQRITKRLIRLRRCAGWSASLLFAYCINRFSHDKAQMYKWASSWEKGTYHKGDPGRLRWACTSPQSRQSLPCSLTEYMGLEKAADKHISDPFESMCMHGWRITNCTTLTFLFSWDGSNVYEPRHYKTNEMAVCPAKTRVSLGICPVWSESSLSRMPRLIWVFAVRMKKPLVLSYWSEASLGAHSLCLSCCGSNIYEEAGMSKVEQVSNINLVSQFDNFRDEHSHRSSWEKWICRSYSTVVFQSLWTDWPFYLNLLDTVLYGKNTLFWKQKLLNDPLFFRII